MENFALKFLENSEIEGIYKFGNSFKFNHEPFIKAVKGQSIHPEVSTNYGIDSANINDKTAEFDYFFNLKTFDSKNKTEYFTIDANYRIVFHYNPKMINKEEFTEENVKSIGPTLKNFLWPYFRNLVQKETVAANMPPLMLPPMKIDLLNNENKTKAN
jgi:preprotein translocase subunit SecB